VFDDSNPVVCKPAAGASKPLQQQHCFSSKCQQPQIQQLITNELKLPQLDFLILRNILTFYTAILVVYAACLTKMSIGMDI
jgi:hypothetical protein